MRNLYELATYMDTHIESVNEEVIPDLAGELVTAYDAQDVAIKEKQQLIKHTHEEIARETVHSRELESELASTNRKIYCAVEENKGHEAKCAELQEELNLMVKNTVIRERFVKKYFRIHNNVMNISNISFLSQFYKVT